MVTKKKYILTIIVVVLLTSILSFTFNNVLLVEFGDKVVLSKDAYNDMKKVSDKYQKQENLMKIAEKDFLYEANEETMLEGALEGTLNALGDPYTKFMTKKEFDALIQDTEGSYEGIGVYITASDDNKILIVSPIEDTPAEKAGLSTGDKIIRINGKEFTSDKIDEAVSIMKGMPGTSVTLTIQREGNEKEPKIFDVSIKREKIKIKTIKSSMLKNNIGYIRITTFDMQTAKDFKDSYQALKNKGIKALVIDLRNNPGGIIDATVEISDIFMGEGVVTYTKTKAGQMEYFNSNKSMETIPIVLLVNEGSASASEIMAGALKDTKRATLIGTKTFGKGIVQSVRRFGNDGEGIKMTVSEYFTPSGINIHGTGIMPDVEIKLPEDAQGYGIEYLETDNQLNKAIETLESKIKQ